MRLGLYGGSFNPIHVGHLICARAVAEALNLERILLIPAAIPPHKLGASLATAADRVAMARAAVQGDPLFEVSDIELDRPGPSYTIDTVRALRELRKDSDEWHWLIGADTLPELESWSRIAALVHEVRFVTMIRPGFPTRTLEDVPELVARLGVADVRQLLLMQLPTPAVDISATDIRRRVAGNRPINYLTPPSVIAYIADHELYQLANT